ncbi:MAG: TetR/AcrR family transcriptional regulator [Oscillospiraceae bacterium]|nr:TetR/AcrR family transcriptional regulator [Oscillospiraceae bacterium]
MGAIALPKQTFFNLSEEKRGRIIGCALAEFADKGYKQASISRIVEAAEIAKGSFYQYFEDKDDLYVHIVVTQIGEPKLGIINREAERLNEMKMGDYIRHLAMTQLDALTAQPELIKISFDLMGMPPNEPVLQKVMKNFDGSFNSHALNIIQRKIDQGEIDSRVDPHLLSFMLTGIEQYEYHLFHSGAFIHIDGDLINKLVDNLNFILTNGIYTQAGKPVD